MAVFPELVCFTVTTAERLLVVCTLLAAVAVIVPSSLPLVELRVNQEAFELAVQAPTPVIVRVLEAPLTTRGLVLVPVLWLTEIPDNSQTNEDPLNTCLTCSDPTNKLLIEDDPLYIAIVLSCYIINCICIW